MTATTMAKLAVAASAHADESELMQRISAGDAEAYHQLVVRYNAQALRVATRVMGSRTDAEDVVQDVFTRLWQGSARWTPQAKFSTWFYRVVWNASIDHLRRRPVVLNAESALEQTADKGALADAALMEAQRAAQLKQAMGELPARQRAAIALCYYEGLSNQAAAESLGVTLNVLQTTLFRARRMLKERLMKDEQHG